MSGQSDRWIWPAEWEEHEATWLSWPRNDETWPRSLEAAQREFVNFVKLLSQFELVRVMIAQPLQEHAEKLGLPRSDRVEWVDLKTNDAWARDYGATIVYDAASGDSRFINWQYNAWGGKYPPFDDDQLVAAGMANYCNANVYDSKLTMEGGAIEGNGAGYLMTTESCLLDDNRNAGWARSEIEAELKTLLGVSDVLWLPGGDVEGDDTDGHIDQIARFLNEKTVLISDAADENNVNHATYRENQVRLQAEIEKRELGWTVVKVPLPSEVVKVFDEPLPASYTNFVWANGAIIVPQFEDAMDQVAVDLIQSLCPDRKVVGCPSKQLLVGLGSWHCLSQQHINAAAALQNNRVD